MRAPLTLFVAVALAAAAPAAAKRASPQALMVLAERVLQHDAHWRPTSTYCLPPKRSPHRTTYRCQWVKQGNSRPWEIDTVQLVYAADGAFLFSLVSSDYAPPHVRAALCRVTPAGAGYRTTCHAK